MPTIRRPDAPRVPLRLQHMVRRRTVRSTLLAVALCALLSSCFRPESTQAVTITELHAPTSTSVLVVLDQPLVALGDPLAMFDIKGAGGARLAVVAVHPDTTNTRFTLATHPQEKATYTLTLDAAGLVPSGGAPMLASREFAGSDVPGPIVTGAVAISNTEVVVRLYDPVAGEAAAPSPFALDATAFQVLASTGEALTVEGVGPDGAGAILLTTAPQEDDTYAVTLGGVYAEPGGRLVDPFNNSAAFLGIASNDGTAPTLLHAESRGPSSVMLRFSEPLAQGAGGIDDPAAYRVLGAEAEELGVSRAQPGNHATEVLLTTVRQQVNGEEYTVTVTTLEDLAGNRVDPAANSATFYGNTTPGEADTTPPRLSNVASTRNNTVVVTFSEPVAGGPSSAENPSHYRIYAAAPGEAAAQATLQVVRAQLDARRTSVTLTTGSQSDVTYTLEVVNVRDLAGNQMAPPERDLLPSGMNFRGTPPAPGELIDSDGDGLTDCQELLVSATCSAIDVYTDEVGVPTLAPRSSNGAAHSFLTTVQLVNRTDPANPDTDGDGLTDLEEVIGFAYTNLSGVRTVITPLTDPLQPYATNPLARDTDFDGLDDRLEVLLGSNPLRPDGDSVRDEEADGLVNAVETAGQSISVVRRGGTARYPSTSDPRQVDTDGDGLTDWEEYFGCRDTNRDFRCDTDERFGPTDPRNADTDGDGLSDRNEVDGLLFQGDNAQPLRRTDPVNWDTDADGRSDGEEMNESWVVNVAGRGGYVVWSDPLRRDADGDGLSDLLEFQDGTDPNEADTDGDGALDSLERARPTSPLVPDHLVTVTYLGLQAGKGSSASAADGDPGSDPGDFFFRYEVRVPNADGSLRLHLITSSWEVSAPACTSGEERFCRGSVDGSPVIQIPAPLVFEMSESYQFAVPFTGLFTIEGLVQEVDPGPIADMSYWFGGFADPNGVFAGSDLQKGSFALAFNDSPRSDVPIEVTVFVRVE